MPFRPKNALETFQCALELIHTMYKWSSCLFYMDDIIIFPKDVEEHLQHVDEILMTLGEARVTLNLKLATSLEIQSANLAILSSPVD